MTAEMLYFYDAMLMEAQSRGLSDLFDIKYQEYIFCTGKWKDINKMQDFSVSNYFIWIKQK